MMVLRTLTGYTLPSCIDLIMLLISLYPTVPSSSLAPITAMLLGLKILSRSKVTKMVGSFKDNTILFKAQGAKKGLCSYLNRSVRFLSYNPDHGSQRLIEVVGA